MDVRWVRTGMERYADGARGCAYCGSCCDLRQRDGVGYVHPAGTCLGCGSRQCNPALRGKCAVCLFGIVAMEGALGGQRRCGYKGCSRPAAFMDVPRVECCCIECAVRPKVGGRAKVTLREHTANCVADRDKLFAEVSR